MSDLKDCRIMELEQENARIKKRNAKAYGTIKELKGDIKTMQATVAKADSDADGIRRKGATLYAYTKWMIDRLHRLESADGVSLDGYEKKLQAEFNGR